MKYEVKAIENKQRETTWRSLGIVSSLGEAYLYSLEAGNELPNFWHCIWDEDIEKIVDDCRRLGIGEFTVSSGYSGVVESIAKFVGLGCVLDGIVWVNERRARYDKGEHDRIPAFKLTVR